MPEQIPTWKKTLRIVLTVVMSLLLVAVFYVAVVMGQPQGNAVRKAESPAEQPLLPALPAAVRITDIRDIERLAEAFPAPILCPMYGNALTLVEGVCSDTAFEKGLARIVTLTYRTEDFSTLTITSIYPARALSLLETGDYHFSTAAGQPLATMRSIRMEDGRSIRLHAQSTDALYVVTFPVMTAAELRSVTSVLQLYQGD